MLDHRNAVSACDPRGIGQRLVMRSVQPSVRTGHDDPRRIEREAEAWLVICRSHAWLFGSRHAAMTEANGIARGFGIAVVEHV